jgi:hypothetical protein
METQIVTKRKIMLFLLVLAILVLVKYAVGQDSVDTVGWDREAGLSLEGYIEATMFAGLLWGSVVGAARVTARNVAAMKGEYFSGDLVCLHL